jgi:3-phosphoshikimate 1-carboxyvinyltransferase
MSSITISRPARPINATVHLPRSKSVSNRALIMASLFGDLDAVKHLGTGDDTRVLYELLRDRPHVMHCGAGGTTFRFLLAWAAVQEGEEHIITGIPRLLERPHTDLVEALRTLGADIQAVPEGFRVRGRRMPGGTVHFDSPISSQYLSALLLVAPRMVNGIHMHWTGTRLSEPFVHMTLRMLAHFGVFPVLELDGVRVPPGDYRAATYTVPPDWSAAAFWYELVALSPGAEVLLPGLDDDTLQGDREARQLWAAWVDTAATPNGMLLTHRSQADAWADLKVPGRPVNMKHVPDLFQPLAFTLAARGEGATLEGLDNLRVKETDRLQAVHEGLTTLGCSCRVLQGTFSIDPLPSGLKPAVAPFDPSIDHRMAMSLAPLAAVLGSITILDPRVVDKSYPDFWEHLRSAGLGVHLQP